MSRRNKELKLNEFMLSEKNRLAEKVDYYTPLLKNLRSLTISIHSGVSFISNIINLNFDNQQVVYIVFYSDIFVINIIKPEKAKINNSLKLVSKFGITHKEKRQVLLHFTFLKSGCKFV